MTITELETLLLNEDLTPKERKTIKMRLYKKRNPEKVSESRKKNKQRRKLDPLKREKDALYQREYQREYQKKARRKNQYKLSAETLKKNQSQEKGMEGK